MNTLNKFVIAMVIFTPTLAQAGEAVVKWHDFNDYSDVRPSNDTKAAYHKRIAVSLEKHFNQLAEQLPKGYKFNIEVTQLDLAGDVHFGGVHEIRVIKPLYFPRIEFKYSVTDKNGKVISESDKVKLKDMGFMDKIKMGRDEAFYYDKRLISDWFNKQLLPKVLPQ